MKKFKQAKDIKVGVIGYGGAYNMGKAHLELMLKAGMTPVAVSEIDPSRLEVAQKDFPGIETYTSVAAMLKRNDVNLITIITPHNTHAQLAVQCLRAGRHVVCEKPLAITTTEVDTMIRTAQKNKVMLSTFHNRHWDGSIMEAMRRVKQKKEIGDLVRIDAQMTCYKNPGDAWRSSRSISGGILYDWGVHLLEYALQLIDSEVTEVSGFAHNGFWAPKTRWKDDTNEDEAFAVVRFKSGQWLTLRFSHVDLQGKSTTFDITGTEGHYSFDYHRYSLVTPAKKGRNTLHTEHPPAEHDRYYQNVADYLTGKAELIITAEWSRRPIHILDLAVRSAREGRALKPKYS
ncbi:MAG: Gfo/Idh/MocA family protein [Candidatus Methylacidiphilales bacterium]